VTPLRAAATAGVAAVTTRAILRGRPPGGTARWQRTNYRGRHPSLLAGPAVTVATTVATLSHPSVAGLAVASGAIGLYDDLAGDAHARGLRGHIAALRARRVTTGMVKLVGLVAAGALASVAERRRPADVVIDTLLVAGTANLVNLFDLRPGRALKVVVLAGAPLMSRAGDSGAVVAGACVGAAVATLPADVTETVMIGDCGANALGSLLGWALAHGLRRPGRVTALVGVVGLTLASERVSFTDVIAGNRWLAALDGLGRAR
jgi:UDP-GlcNAc:undecaprenyl-phosphate/decaprenyl-phosphate GlcNAc-1-phosphate transferase